METKLVDINNGNTPLKKLIELVSSGVEVVLTEGQAPVARLVPFMRGMGPRTPGLHLGKIWVSNDFDAPLSDAFWLGDSET